MEERVCLRVVKEPHGWAVRLGEGLMTPFRSCDRAVDHANGYAEALRAHGQVVEVLVEQTFAPAARISRGRSHR